MTTIRQITAFDWVELLEPIDGVPPGARGGVLELRPDDMAMVEIMTIPRLDAAERIIFAPLSKLRHVEPPAHATASPDT